jgi:glycyl-tRNA synthetase beta chain
LALEFLFELGCEEIPARYVDLILRQLSQEFIRFLAEAKLTHQEVESFATPRRLVLHIAGLAASQADRTELITGPPVSAAFDRENAPTKAADGFARKMGAQLTDLIRVTTDRGEYLAFEDKIPGKFARDILLEEIPKAIKGLELPKNMKWESGQFLFIRPIRWIIGLLGGEVLPLQLADVRASNWTHGHRILRQNIAVQVKDYEEYKKSLLNLNVCFDPRERLRRIQTDLELAASALKGKLIEDPELLQTVIYLNEYPTIVRGFFDSSYLRLPREVLVTVMREHQKYFSLLDESGGLMACFLAVVDSDETHHDLIRAGHERVLRARLADAGFFWDQDRRVTLGNRVELLRHVVFQAGLGTMFEKCRRLVTLTQFIAKSIKRRDLFPGLEAAATLCKADLTTEMVKEFTNLQGVVGGLYAEAEGLPSVVSEAIYDHYRPISLEDQSPRGLTGALLSVADKVDSVIGAFSVGLVPTGSRDPLALRRQTLGLIKVLLDHRLPVSIAKLARRSHAALKRYASRGFDEIWTDFNLFFRDRLRFIFKEQGFRFDEVNSILQVSSDNPLECLERLKAISQMRDRQDFTSLATSFKRIRNILSKAGLDQGEPLPIDPLLFRQDEEMALYSAVERLRPKITRCCRKQEYFRAFELMADIRPEVDLFFEKVLVMAEDERLQRNRLGLLRSLLKVFLEVADVSEIVAA